MDRYIDQIEQEVLRILSPLAAGSSFESLIRKLIHPYRDQVELVIGDILTAAPADQDIEIAFFDCLKNSERDAKAFRAFYPRFVPGHTIVLQQDYFYESAAANKIRQEFLAPHFEYLGQVATTAVFKNTSPIPSNFFDEDPLPDLSLEDQVAFLRRAAARATSDKTRILTELSILEHLIDQKAFSEALLELDRLRIEITLAPTDQITRRPQNILTGLQGKLTNFQEQASG